MYDYHDQDDGDYHDGYKKKEDDGGENFVGGGDHVNEYGDDEGICFYSIFLR